MNIPSQYLPIMPYLILKDAKEFAGFMKTVFNASEQLLIPEGEKVRHGQLRIGDAVIMFADANDTWNKMSAGMFIYVRDVNEVYNSALISGAKSLMPPEKKEYGFTAGFEDPFGNHFWIVQGE